MLPSGLYAESYAPQNATAASRDPSADSGPKPASDGDANHDGQGNPSGRRLVFKDPKALAIFQAVNNNTFDVNLLPSYLRSKLSNRQTQGRDQPRMEPAYSGTLSVSSSGSLPPDSASAGRGAHQADHWAGQPPSPISPANDIIAAMPATAAAAVAVATAAAGGCGAAAAPAPPPPAVAPRTHGRAAASCEARVTTTHQPAPPPPWMCPSVASVAAPVPASHQPRATPYQPVTQAQPLHPMPSMPYPPAPPVGAAAPPVTLYPSAPAAAAAPPPQPLPPAASPQPQPQPACPLASAAPAALSAPPPLLPVAAPQPADLSRIIVLEPVAPPPAVPPPSAAQPQPPAAGSHAGPWMASGEPPSAPTPAPPQQPAAAAADAAAAAAALEACLRPQPCRDQKHTQLRVRAVLALAMSRAWDDCVRAHHLHPHQQHGPPGVAGQPAPGVGPSGQAAAPGPGAAAAPAPAAGALTRPQLLQFGWTTAQLDELFMRHFPPWPPGKMAFISVAVMYEELGKGIVCRGLRPKPGGGGADMVLAPCDSWGRERAAEMERLRGALAPLEAEARSAHEAARQATEAEAAERERAAQRQAQRQRQELEPAGAAPCAPPGAAEAAAAVAGGVDEAKWPSAEAARLREIVLRTRMFLRMKLGPHLVCKDPKPVPLAEVLAGLRDAAHIDLDAETVAELGASSVEALFASLADVVEVRRGEDGSVGLLASELYRRKPARREANLGLHRRCGLQPPPPLPLPAEQPQQPQQQPAGKPQQAEQPPPPQQQQLSAKLQQAEQPQGAQQPQLPQPPQQLQRAGACRLGNGNPGQQRQQQQQQHSCPTRLGGPHLGAAQQQRPQQHQHQQQRQQKQHNYQHQHQQQQRQMQQHQRHQQCRQQQGAPHAPPTLYRDLGSGPLPGAGSWPLPGIIPGNTCGLPPPLPSIFPGPGGLPQLSPQISPQASSQLHPHPQPQLQCCFSATAAGSSATTAFPAASREAAAVVAAAAGTVAAAAAGHSLAASGGSSGYLSGGSCVASSGSASGADCGGGSASRPLSSSGPAGSGCGRLESAASDGGVKRVRELPPHLRPKPASRPTPPPQPQQQQQQLAQMGGWGAAAASSPVGGGGAGGPVAAPVSREWQSVGGELTVRIDQWQLAQAEALGADCLAACRGAGCGTCWQVIGYREDQVAASSWGPTREAAIQALRQVLLGWAQQSAALG